MEKKYKQGKKASSKDLCGYLRSFSDPQCHSHSWTSVKIPSSDVIWAGSSVVTSPYAVG